MPMADGKRSVAETFSRLREQGKTAFIPFITAGDPDLATTAKALKILDSCGSDVIELGVPYSDPLADGPVIQAAAYRALKKGTTLHSVLSMLKEVIPELSCPIVLFTYCNPILKLGVQNFMDNIKQAGVHGLVVPDLPLEETTLLRSEATLHNIELVLLTTPTTPTCDQIYGLIDSHLRLDLCIFRQMFGPGAEKMDCYIKLSRT
uniref:Uncharacterized protein n=1 Tax=Avena sativa TaxID=4498 RepID=A0ACD6A6X7_AVESA